MWGGARRGWRGRGGEEGARMWEGRHCVSVSAARGSAWRAPVQGDRQWGRREGLFGKRLFTVAKQSHCCLKCSAVKTPLTRRLRKTRSFIGVTGRLRVAARAGPPHRRASGGAEAPAGGRLWCGARVGSGVRECARAGALGGASASNSLRREFEGNLEFPSKGIRRELVVCWKYYASCRAHPATIT